MPPEEFTIGQKPVIDVIRQRRSHRYFTEKPLTLEELSFLLWATQGIRATTTFDGITYYFRNVPSGGNRHPIETYLNIHRVEGFVPSPYRYLQLEHNLILLKEGAELSEQVSIASLEQASKYRGKSFFFVRECAVVFIWITIPYRSKWRYGPVPPKLITLADISVRIFTLLAVLSMSEPVPWALSTGRRWMLFRTEWRQRILF